MKCPRCGAANPEGKSFCGDCGAPLPQRCRMCGSDNPPEAKSCGTCGGALTESAFRQADAATLPAASTLLTSVPTDAEHRPLTVAFCDLVGSTGLSARLDPEDLREVFAVYQRCVAETVARYQGFIARYAGDGVLVYFGYPQAHEDDAERAVIAGLALVEAIGKLRPALLSEPLQVRVGIATGRVIVGDLIGAGAAQERAAVGETLNLAARLQALAEANTVVICAGTKRLTGGLFQYRDLGTAQVKGFPEPIKTWEVARPIAIESRFEALHPDARTPLVGRDENIDLLLGYWEQAKTGGGRAVLLSGEPGIGKSRIAAELVERLSGEAHAHFSFFCSPHHADSALHPLIARIERAAGFERDDSPDRKLRKLDALLAFSTGQSESVALLAELLSIPTDGRLPAANLSPQQKKDKTLAALLGELEALAMQRPVLIICEDAHWIDPTSQELLDRLVSRIGALPVLLLVTSRPEFQPPWIGRPHVTMHLLNRLDRRIGGAIIDHLARGKPLPQKVTEQILERTDGVPLFIEELTKMFLESGVLREESDRFVLDGPLLPLAVPATLQASLVARLDRLAPVREIAQIGASIGREFSYEMLAAVSSLGEHELQGALSQFTSSGLIFRRGMPPHSTYVFKHALVQDAAYGTLLRSRRRQLHSRIGSALEQRFPDIVQSQPEVVARHYTEAGLAAKAIDYWLKAGHLAGARSANVEARAHLTKGLELLHRLPPGSARDRQELAFQELLGPALIATKGHTASEPIAAYERAVELIRLTGETSHHDSVFFGLFMIYYNHAAFTKGLELAREFLRLSEQRNETMFCALAHGALAGMYSVLGEFTVARDHGTQAFALYKPTGKSSPEWRYVIDLVTTAKSQLAIPVWHLGFPNQSVALERYALTSAARLNQPTTTGYMLSFAALSAFRRRDFNELGGYAARLQAHGREHAMLQLVAYGTCSEGPAITATDPRKAVAQIESGIALCEEMKNKAYRPVWLAGLAEAQLAADRTEEALHAVDEGLATAEQTAEHWMDAELLRLKGQILLAVRHRDAKERAEACFRDALACAGGQRSKMLSLRAATSLAGLWNDQGRRIEARELLAPCYDSFTEGFDTPDLKHAKSLLNTLQ